MMTPTENLAAARDLIRCGAPITLTPATASALADALEAVRWATRLDKDLIGRIGYTELAMFADAYVNQE